MWYVARGIKTVRLVSVSILLRDPMAFETGKVTIFWMVNNPLSLQIQSIESYRF